MKHASVHPGWASGSGSLTTIDDLLLNLVGQPGMQVDHEGDVLLGCSRISDRVDQKWKKITSRQGWIALWRIFH